jgi:hypothetical protein
MHEQSEGGVESGGSGTSHVGPDALVRADEDIRPYAVTLSSRKFPISVFPSAVNTLSG